MIRYHYISHFCLALILGLSGYPRISDGGEALNDWLGHYELSDALSDPDHDEFLAAVAEYFLGGDPSTSEVLARYQSLSRESDGSYLLQVVHNPLVRDVCVQPKVLSGEGWVELGESMEWEGNVLRYSFSLPNSARQIVRMSYREGMRPVLMSGADISMLARIEELGTHFSRGGVAGDGIEIMRDAGMNWFRLRLFVDPNGENQVVNDLEYTLSLAQRIHDAGAGFLLDLHYSDTWADPDHQSMPSAWSGLNYDELERQVESYTREVLQAFKEAGCLPEMVQVGNEVSNGFLWPMGQLYAGGDETEEWDAFVGLLNAGIRGVRVFDGPGHRIRIMVHYNNGAYLMGTRYFYDKLRERDVDFDCIGLSYYPWWHGSLAELKANLDATAERFHKALVIAETAYPQLYPSYWNSQENMGWEVSAAGQQAFIEDLVEVLSATYGSYGGGLFDWYPEAVATDGVDVWNGGATALFDPAGEVLPAADVFQPVP